MEDMIPGSSPRSLAEAPELWDAASPMSWVGPRAPPFLVAHGANDQLVPVEQARSFVSMLQAASKTGGLRRVPRAQHAFELFNSVRTLHALQAIDRFLAVVRTAHGARAVPTDASEPASPSSEISG